ncbi:hypothetical protein SMGD1_2011 [Sulfurimonas gotlandica GD1]|uniref:Uncharacterized protein n=1 Tax=Sulfurimonas gotlandica (strain DSM 19862 / JCM 16533 / GD1) TaxID=929558 RepID=B6BJ19_SULGG|nr:hypothetical protein [Sulfurimonas gotlandica]EDZ62965.1 hypothetical protein CBGD1_583 [Sulfurimonas gotlandica GD1]EHP30534.1 hypothetical protein SMGD1_2011 [Sulfurimonas gotlandica GD1]
MAATETFNVSCKNGSIPNDKYSIEYYNGEYRAKRGTFGGGTGIGSFRSRDDAYRAIEKDAHSSGGTGVVIK